MLLALAALAVGLAAADTYVVVLALPDMMASTGLSVEELSRAAPIISGFLLGYVAMLPLLGRVADLHGRVPVLVASLLIFSFGSLVTAAAYDLPSVVIGRFLQGTGGGGLVPVTLALVAEMFPPQRRGLPLGIVGAVQELGSVLGPLAGAAIITLADWRAIFWLNLAGGLALLAAVVTTMRVGQRDTTLSKIAPLPPGQHRRADLVGLLGLAVWLSLLLLVMRQPEAVVTSVRWGAPLVPFVGTNVWFSPAGLSVALLSVALVGWWWWAAHPLIQLRAWWASVRQADLLGAGLLALALAGIILTFSTADPQVHTMAANSPWYLSVAGLATVLFCIHQWRSSSPLLPLRELSSPAAAGSLVVSFWIGVALIAALIDIPVFARLTLYPDSQIKAALVLVEFLVALPIGALCGGALLRYISPAWITSVGMTAAASAFAVMANWSADALEQLSAIVVLVGCGFGFGLAIAPVNAALLAATRPALHGVASALLVVARMIGMLVGISVLTTLGLRRYYHVSEQLPSIASVCGQDSICAGYTMLLQQAGLEQLYVIFWGAAAAAVIAACVAAVSLRTTGQIGVTESISQEETHA